MSNETRPESNENDQFYSLTKNQTIMALKYAVVQQKYDITGKGVLKYFAKAQSTGVMDMRNTTKKQALLLC
jgi:hypothetical protein